MKKLTANVVKETTITAGTGSVTLVAASGWARFSDCFVNNDRAYYSIRDGINWEIGLGTYLTANQLARTTILETFVAGVRTVGGAAMTLSGAAASVRAVAPEKAFTNAWLVEPTVCNINATLVAGSCNMVTASAITLTLPASPAQGDRLEIIQAAAAITGVIVSPGAEKINNTAGSMTIDLAEFAITLVYIDASYGWKVS